MNQKIHTRRDTLSKSERLCTERRIGAVFSGGRRGGAGPLKFCWVVRADDEASSVSGGGNDIEKGTSKNTTGAGNDIGGGTSKDTAGGTPDDAAVSVLFSVPKKVFKRAWKRNLMKRRMRESYRQRKHELAELARSLGRRIDIALICMPEGAVKSKNKGKERGAAANGAAAKTAAHSPVPAVHAPAVVVTTKKSGARKTQEVPLPDFKTIDDAIETILAQIAARLRR